MNLLSIQVGTPQSIVHQGREILTSFFKQPIDGPVLVKTLSIEGDTQADLRVHGGRDKAVYAYAADAYSFWNDRYKTTNPYGSLGENLTFDELDEDKIAIGDIYDLGQCRLQVTQPRFPCFKLGVRFDDPQAVKVFNEFCRPGVYFRVLREGEIESGNSLKLIERVDDFISVKEVYQMKMQQT